MTGGVAGCVAAVRSSAARSGISVQSLPCFQMSGRAAKLARVIPIETPDNSSSDSESEGEEGRDAEIQVS